MEEGRTEIVIGALQVVDGAIVIYQLALIQLADDRNCNCI